MFLSDFYIIFESLIFAIVPITIFKKHPHLLKFRHLFLISITVYILFISTQIDLPIITNYLTTPNYILMLFYCIFPSIIVSYYFFTSYHRIPPSLTNFANLVKPNLHPNFTLFLYIILSVPLQEIIFRYFYMSRIGQVNHSPLFIIIISSLVFGLAHIPFGKKDPFITSFFLGLYWGLLFYITQNLWYPIISHAIIGATFLWLTIYPPTFNKNK